MLIIALFYKAAKQNKDENFRLMWFTIVLSFAFYISVVLWADAIPLVGMLMIPKTLVYVWAILIGYKDMQRGDCTFLNCCITSLPSLLKTLSSLISEGRR